MKHVRETKKYLESLGLICDVEKTTKHIKYYVRKGLHKKMFVRPASPSDFRSTLNFQSDVRKWLKECEVKNGSA